MTPINPSLVLGEVPGAGTPVAPPVGKTNVAKAEQPVTRAAQVAAASKTPGLASRQETSVQRTVQLGKAGPLLAHLAGDEKPRAQQVIQAYCTKAASCDKVFKQNGQFQGFVNGFVGGSKGQEGIKQIETAYRDYCACGLAKASADEIKTGIAGFAGKIDTSPFALAIGNRAPLQAAYGQDVRAACDQYLGKALTAYPGLFEIYGEEHKALRTQIISKTVALIEDINKDQNTNPKITVAQAVDLIKENLDKILYQQFRDQSMITGSDHGIHHIVMGNIHNSLAILDGCQEVTPQEKLMVLQTMVDHDLGYTTYAAQADFGAAKDHPLASRAYVDQNMNSIFKDNSSFQRLGAEAFIKDSILSHSYATGLDQPLDFANNKTQSLRNVVAVVDAMGTTQDTKLPSVFRQPQIQEQLFRVGFAQLQRNPHIKSLEGQIKQLKEANPQNPTIRKLQNQLSEIKGEIENTEDACRSGILQAINEISDAVMPQALKARYWQAIQVDFNAFGATGIMPQFAGKILNTKAISANANGQGDPYKISINMEVSLAEKYAQAIGGAVDVTVQDKFKAFNKMADDIVGEGHSLGAQIDEHLYWDNDAFYKPTYQTSTPLINFTFQRSEADTERLRAYLP